MKQHWLAAVAEARELVAALPPDEIGCLYLDPNRTPVTPVPGDSAFAVLIRHKGSTCGAWPTVSTYLASGQD
jgi:hypothetical protein